MSYSELKLGGRRRRGERGRTRDGVGSAFNDIDILFFVGGNFIDSRWIGICDIYSATGGSAILVIDSRCEIGIFDI